MRGGTYVNDVLRRDGVEIVRDSKPPVVLRGSIHRGNSHGSDTFYVRGLRQEQDQVSVVLQRGELGRTPGGWMVMDTRNPTKFHSYSMRDLLFVGLDTGHWSHGILDTLSDVQVVFICT